TVTAKFKSGFRWILYEYLKANYGYLVKEISKEALMRLFAVEIRKSYMKSNAQSKRGVLETDIDEIKEITELEDWYKEKKIANKKKYMKSSAQFKRGVLETAIDEINEFT